MEKKVLVIEDDEDLSFIYTVRLNDAGYEVYTAVDRLTTEEQILSQEFDIILMDMMLIGTTGLELCPFIREHTNAPIIFISCVGDNVSKIDAFDAELQEKAQDAGVDLNDDKQDEIEPEEIEAIEIAAEEIEAEEIEAIEIEAEEIIAEEYADEIDFLVENADPETLMLAIEAGIAEQEAADAENAAELRKFFDEIKTSMEKSQNDGKSEAAKEEMNLEDLMKAIEKGIAEEEAENAKAAAQLREFYESIKTTLEKSKAAESK